MVAGRRHKVISLSTKIAVIDAVEARTKLKSEVADSFGLPKSTVSTILKNIASYGLCMRIPNLNLREREFIQQFMVILKKLSSLGSSRQEI